MYVYMFSVHIRIPYYVQCLYLYNCKTSKCRRLPQSAVFVQYRACVIVSNHFPRNGGKEGGPPTGAAVTVSPARQDVYSLPPLLPSTGPAAHDAGRQRLHAGRGGHHRECFRSLPSPILLHPLPDPQ